MKSGLRWLCAVAGAAGLAFLVSQQLAEQAGAHDASHLGFLEDPQPAPLLDLPGLDGQPVRTADWRGKVAIVNFWATWCGPCEVEVPDFVALQTKYREHVVFVGLAIDEPSKEGVQAFAQRHQVNYPIALVDESVAGVFGGLLGLPTTFVLDREGRIVQKHVGLVSPDVYEAEIRALAGLPPLPTEPAATPPAAAGG